MVAVVVLVLGLFPVYKAIRRRTVQARFQKIRSFALSMCQNYIERTRGCSLMYLDGSGPQQEAAQRYGLANLWAGPEDVNALVTTDPLLNPKAGDPGVPNDPEMQVLLAEWEKRKGIYAFIPGKTGPGWKPELADVNMRIHVAAVAWGSEKEAFRAPESLEEFQLGKNGKRYVGSDVLSLAVLTGEGLFHPPPTMTASP